MIAALMPIYRGRSEPASVNHATASSTGAVAAMPGESSINGQLRSSEVADVAGE